MPVSISCYQPVKMAKQRCQRPSAGRWRAAHDRSSGPRLSVAAFDKPACDEKGKFLLTGPADIFRSAKTQEALPGHMARLELLPLSLSELTQTPLNIIDYIVVGDFQPAQAKALGSPIGRQALAAKILRGGYPELRNKSPRAKRVWFKSYTEGRLFKDFESLYAARDDYHSKLKAMMPCLAGLSGNLLKYSNIANDLALNDKLVKSYIEILDLTFIIRGCTAKNNS